MGQMVATAAKYTVRVNLLYDPAAAAWLNAVVAAGGTISDAQAQRINNLIIGLKADGIWSKFDRLWLFASENTQQALLDLVVRGQATAVGGPTFTANRGYTGQDTSAPTQYINTNFAPNAGIRTQNSGHLSAWVTVYTPPASSGGVDAGASVNSFDLIATNRLGQSYAILNDGNVQFAMPPSLAGFWITNRTGATANSGYVNNVLQFSTSNASQIVNSDNLYALCYNTAGPSLGAPDTIGELSLGAGLTSTDLTNFYSRLTTYFTSIGGVTQIETFMWMANVEKSGGTVSSAQKTLVDTLIAGLKTDGIWTKLDRLWLFAAENSQQALLDLVAQSTATVTGTLGTDITFTANRGYAATNTGLGYLNTGFISGTNFASIANHSRGFWITTKAQINADIMGSQDATMTFDILGNNGSSQWTSRVAGTSINFTPAPQPGFFHDNMTSGTLIAYLNGVLMSGSGSGFSGTIPAFSEYVLGRNNQGTLTGVDFAFDQISTVFFGGPMTATDAANFYSRLTTYMGAQQASFWVSQVVASGGTVSAGRQTLVQNLVIGLMQDGVWGKLDRLWIFAAENQASALEDLVGGNTATAVNSPIFTTDRGFAGNGSSSYINTGRVLTTGPNYSQGSAMWGIWINTLSVVNLTASMGVIGANATINQCFLATGSPNQWLMDDGNKAINSAGGTVVNADTNRFISTTIAGTGTSQVQSYGNGIAVGSLGGSAPSSPATTNTVFIDARNNAGSADSYAAHQVSAYVDGGFLSATDMSNLYSRLRTYLTAIGVP